MWRNFQLLQNDEIIESSPQKNTRKAGKIVQKNHFRTEEIDQGKEQIIQSLILPSLLISMFSHDVLDRTSKYLLNISLIHPILFIVNNGIEMAILFVNTFQLQVIRLQLQKLTSNKPKNNVGILEGH